MAEQSFHVRSVSMPSRSHPATLKINEELYNLRVCQASTSSSPSTSASSTELMCKRLRSLGDLYIGIEDLLHLPSARQCFSNSNQRKWLEEEVDGSLATLDLCSTMKSAVVALKEHVQDLQLALRRKANISSKVELQVFHSLEKQMQSVVKKSYKELKKQHSKHQSAASHEDSDLFDVLKELNEVRQTTVSELLSVYSLISPSTTKSTRWSFASKVMLKKRTKCEDSIAMQHFYILATDKTSSMPQDQLEGIKISLEGLENGLECLYRALIQHRVSVLNIISL